MGIFDAFTGKAAKKAAEENKRAFNEYGIKGNALLDEGYNTGVGNLNNAIGAFSPLAALSSKYGAGTNLYMDSLGVNGAAGNANAVGAFQAGPGYQWQLGQGMDAINRRRAAGGMLDSGNADIDAMTYGQGLANQTYGQWQQGLAGLVNPELASATAHATGTASGYGGLATLASNNAMNKVNLAGNVTKGTTDATNMAAAAEMAGAKNLFNLGTNLLGGGLGWATGSSGSFLGNKLW